MKQQTVKQFFEQFHSNDACLEHLFQLSYGQGHPCSRCKQPAKWYKLTKERAYSCSHCGNHLHPCVGTIFEDSRTPLQLWFFAMYLFASTRHGVSAKELQRQLGVTYKCAWRIGHKIREHMANLNSNKPLSGVIEVDEALIGGKNNKGMGRANKGKTLVLGIVERQGDIRTEIVPDYKRDTLCPIIEANVTKDSDVYTDSSHSFKALPSKGYNHKAINHSKGYVDGDVHTGTVDGFWSIIQRSIRSTHISVSSKHMKSYLGEFEYRYNLRKSPGFIFTRMVEGF